MRRLPIVIALGGFLVSAGTDGLFLAAQHHGEFWWSNVYGFFSLFGLVGCLVIIGFATLLGQTWLTRRARYYDIEERHE